MKNLLSELGAVLWTGLLILAAMMAFTLGLEWVKVLLVAKAEMRTFVSIGPALGLFAVFAFLSREAYLRIAKPDVCVHHLAMAVGDYLNEMAGDDDYEDEDDIEVMFEGFDSTITRTPDGKGYRIEAIGSEEGEVHLVDFYGPDAFERAEFYALEAYGSYSMDAALSDEVGVVAS